jgi:hypothetical protein
VKKNLGTKESGELAVLRAKPALGGSGGCGSRWRATKRNLTKKVRLEVTWMGKKRAKAERASFPQAEISQFSKRFGKKIVP